MSSKPDHPGKGNGNGRGGSEYIIDETVTVSNDDPVKSWDLDYNPQDEETHVIRAIARTGYTELRAYILPKEELEFFEDEENIWWEYRSTKRDRIEDAATVSHEDEKPYYHDGNYVLVIKAVPKNRRSDFPEEPKFSVKYRRE